MSNPDPQVYGLYSLIESGIPPRSQLYSLEPVGVGTPYGESLTGYVMRLCQAHGVTPYMMLKDLILPYIRKTFPGNSGNKTHSVRSSGENAHYINLLGSVAHDWMYALGNLTGRSDLGFLTLYPWRNVLPSKYYKGLSRKHRMWCPLCYQEWADGAQPIYEPLLWNIGVVTVCPHHHVYLQSLCPYCEQSMNPLSQRSRPGYCSNCGEWLGLTTPTAVKGIRDGEDIEKAIWIANAVGEVVANTPYLPKEPSGENIVQMLKACQTSVVGGKSIDLAQKIGRPKSSVSEWLQGEHIPHVDIILEICHIFDISLLQFLTGDTAAIARSDEPTPKTRQDSRRPRLDKDEEYFHDVRQQLQAIVDSNEVVSLTQVTRKIGHCEQTLTRYFPTEWEIIKSRVNNRIDKNKLRQVLEAELNSDEDPPPSMSEITQRVRQRLGYNERCSRLYFPDICCAISKRYKDYRSVQNQRRIQQQCEEVRRLTRLIYEQGLYPSTRRLRENGFAWIKMREPAIRAAYDDELRQLGLKETQN